MDEIDCSSYRIDFTDARGEPIHSGAQSLADGVLQKLLQGQGLRQLLYQPPISLP